jgi:hypothetical protein
MKLKTCSVWCNILAAFAKNAHAHLHNGNISLHSFH